MALTDLSELSLLNIFNRLPLWKVLQLASLCHQLNNIKQQVFRKRTELRLLGGCRISSYQLCNLKKYIQFLGVDQNEIKFNFDLILKFDPSLNNDNVYHGLRVIDLSHDIHVRNLEQIMELAQMFPNLKKLTIAFTYSFPSSSLVQLLRNWPKLTHLYFVDFQYNPQIYLGYDNAIMAINNLHDLQVLAIHSTGPLSSRNWPLKILEPLLQNEPNLKTLYFPVGCVTRLDGPNIEFDDLGRGSRASLQIPFDRFECFGLVDYSPDSEFNDTNEQFISKTTRLEVDIGRELRHLVNWSALQYLCFTVDLEENSLSHVLNPLIHLHNLHEFILINESNVTFRMPLESRARQLPQLASVRRFEFCSVTSPCELYRFKWALPNVSELRLRLFYSYELTKSMDLASFCTFIDSEYDDVLSESCAVDIKRAFVAYGSEIQNFFWVYYRNGRKCNGVAELVLLVEPYTKIIAGMRRINFYLEEIDQFSIDE